MHWVILGVWIVLVLFLLWVIHHVANAGPKERQPDRGRNGVLIEGSRYDAPDV